MGDRGSLIGRVLQNTYRIERKISAGSMGAIYELSHLRLSRKRLAVKVLHPSVVEHKSMLARFRREAEVTSAIGHPHIIDVLDINETDDGAPYIIMERLDGEDLGQRIDRRKRLTLTETATILRQAASALHAAHQEGVVHRDLKPPNIFLCKRGERDDYVKLLDFGISKVMGAGHAMTGINDVIGSPSYMAPEQITSPSEVGPRIDVYAMGALVYEMLTGVPPILANSVMALFEAIKARVPPPMHHQQPDVPREISAVVARALRKNRDERYATMRELWEAFEAALEAVKIDFDEPTEDRQTLWRVPTDAADSLVAEQSSATNSGLSPQLTGPNRPAALSAQHTGPSQPAAALSPQLTGPQARAVPGSAPVVEDDDDCEFDADAETIVRKRQGEPAANTSAPSLDALDVRPRAVAEPRGTHQKPKRHLVVATVALALVVAVLGVLAMMRHERARRGAGTSSGSAAGTAKAPGSAVIGSAMGPDSAVHAPARTRDAAAAAAATMKHDASSAKATGRARDAAAKRDHWPLGRRPEPGDEQWIARQRRRRERASKSKSKSKSKTKTKTKTETETEAKTKAEPETKTKTKTKAEPPETEPETKTKAEPETKTKTKPPENAKAKPPETKTKAKPPETKKGKSAETKKAKPPAKAPAVKAPSWAK